MINAYKQYKWKSQFIDNIRCSYIYDVFIYKYKNHFSTDGLVHFFFYYITNDILKICSIYPLGKIYPFKLVNVLIEDKIYYTLYKNYRLKLI